MSKQNMVIDFKDSIQKVMKNDGEGNFICQGATVGNSFIPADMIKQLYEKVFLSNGSIKHKYCKVKPDNNSYEYYQWNGDPKDIECVGFLSRHNDCFTIGCIEYQNYHLDYHDPRSGEISDVFPGDYIVNMGGDIKIYRKDYFESRFFYR